MLIIVFFITYNDFFGISHACNYRSLHLFKVFLVNVFKVKPSLLNQKLRIHLLLLSYYRIYRSCKLIYHLVNLLFSLLILLILMLIVFLDLELIKLILWLISSHKILSSNYCEIIFEVRCLQAPVSAPCKMTIYYSTLHLRIEKLPYL